MDRLIGAGHSNGKMRPVNSPGVIHRRAKTVFFRDDYLANA
jgi:hypothetical protein